MNKYQQMNQLIQQNNGYLFTADVEKAGISRTYMLRYIREMRLEQVAHGIYITESAWTDQLFILQKRNPKAIFSGETAAYLNGMLEREYSEISVSVPKGHNGSRLRAKGIVVHQENSDLYNLGTVTVKTNYGNDVRTYNSARCVCDFVKHRAQYEVQTYQSVIKSYMANKDKDLSLLMSYAEILKINDEIMKYVEVLV